MNKTQVKRLLNVAKALRESERPEFFTMGRFGFLPFERIVNSCKAVGTYAPECGTPACALGHYAARKDLQKTFTLSGNRCNAAKLAPDGSGRVGVAEKHFGISYREYLELFDSGGCGRAQTPKTAALYIERFVARKIKERS